MIYPVHFVFFYVKIQCNVDLKFMLYYMLKSKQEQIILDADFSNFAVTEYFCFQFIILFIENITMKIINTALRAN